MKLRKKCVRIFALLLSTWLVIYPFGITAVAAGRTPANYVQKDIAFETQYAEAIDKIYQETMNFSEVIYIDEYNIPRRDFSRLRTELISTHAELSPILDTTYCYQFNVSDDVIIALFPIYAYSRDEAEQRLRDFYSEADKYLSLVDDSMDEFTKAVVLHDAMVLDAEYVITKRNEDGVEVLSNNYYQMIEKWGSYETYTEVYAYLLAQVGIHSEIVNSGEMNHEWLKVCLDGNYYHVDLTFDDPIPDRLGRVSHRYFLYSDETFSTEDESNDRRAHVGFETHTDTDDRYDNAHFHNYNTRMCWLDGKLYAIDKNTGELVYYDHKTNIAVPLKTIGEMWSAENNYHWIGCFSGLEVYGDQLYYNTPKAVYSFCPATGESEKIADTTSENEFYSVLIRKGKLYGVVAKSPLVTGSLEYLMTLEEEPPTEPHTEPHTEVPTQVPATVEDINVLAGTTNWLCNGWYSDPDSYVMTKGQDGIYSITIPDVEATPEGENYSFKVVTYVEGDISRARWNGYDNTDRNVDFRVTGTCDVTITFNPTTGEITVEGAKVTNPEYVLNTVSVVGAGEGGFLDDESWNLNANVMTEVEDGVYRITFIEVAPNTEYQFKFAANGSWDINWGAMGVEDKEPNRIRDAKFNSPDNIYFTTDSAAESVDITVTLDLREWNTFSKQGATYKITVTPHGELPTEPITEPTTEPEKQLVSLNITKLPDKTSYVYGETLDLSGMQVTAVYSDYSVETVTDYAVTPLQNAIGTQTVTLTYEGKTASFNVWVGKGELTDLILENAPNKRHYQTGEALDLTGMILVAEYDSGYTEYVTDCEAEANLNEEGYTVPVTLTYSGKSVSYTVRVTAPVLLGINISKTPDKIQYLPGEAFDPAGMTVTAFYNDGTKRQITDYTVSPMDAQGGVQQLTVSWQDKTALLTVVVYPLGDINKDGIITIADVTLLQKALVDLVTLDESERQLADFNQDGEISIADATLIQIQISQ